MAPLDAASQALAITQTQCAAAQQLTPPRAAAAEVPHTATPPPVSTCATVAVPPVPVTTVRAAVAKVTSPESASRACAADVSQASPTRGDRQSTGRGAAVAEVCYTVSAPTVRPPQREQAPALPARVPARIPAAEQSPAPTELPRPSAQHNRFADLADEAKMRVLSGQTGRVS